MLETENSVIIHLMGETDFTSYAYPRTVFDEAEALTEDHRQKLAQAIGFLLAGDNWHEIEGTDVRPGQTYSQHMAELAVMLVAGTEAAKITINNGHNLISLCVFSAPPGEDGKPRFEPQILAGADTDTFDSTKHYEITFHGIRALSEFFVESICAGRFSGDGILGSIVGFARQIRSDEGQEVLSAGVQFQEITIDGNSEVAIVCAADSDLATGLGGVEKLIVGLWSGIVPTPHGGVGYWIWEVGVATPYRFLVEHFLDIHGFPNETYDTIMAAPATRFILRDRLTGEITRHITLDMEIYKLPNFQRMAMDMAREEGDHDFAKACQHVLATLDPEDVYANAA